MATSTNPLKAAMTGMKPKQSAPRIVKREPLSSNDKQGSDTAPSRVGKKAITGHFEPLVARQLKLLAVESDRSIQSFLEEAINDLFRKHGKSPLA